VAGKIIADIIEAPAGRISLNVANVTVASINASGLYTSTGDLLITQANQIDTAAIVDGAVTRAKIGYPGAVLQVVQGTTTTETILTSSTFTDTNLTATITPTSATSKILVLVNQAGCGKETGNTYLLLRLLRNSTVISNFERFGAGNNSTSPNGIGSCSVCFLDSPSTTSAVTYKTQLASALNTSLVFVQGRTSGVSSESTITLMEIAA
jgi:hypothetical protein